MDKSNNRREAFHFKQFSVSDHSCSMKIGTDGVMLGAWCGVENVESAWDIGAGSGLIALMIAQRGVKSVTAVEIDNLAADAAAKNVAASPWPKAVTVINSDIQTACSMLPHPIDLIVSNPPFFTETLKSPDALRRLARHEQSLTFDLLFTLAAQYLTRQGHLSIIAPYQRAEELTFKARLQKLAVSRIASIVTKHNATPKRILMEFSKSTGSAPESEIIEIRGSDGEFSKRYTDLTRDFYLNIN